MNAIEHAQQLIDRLNSTQPGHTQIRAIATEYGKNQETADELWKHGGTSSRLLALLMLDLKGRCPPQLLKGALRSLSPSTFRHDGSVTPTAVGSSYR